MGIRISSELHAHLLALAAADPGNEVCGLLLGDFDVEMVIPTPNIAADPSRTFEIDPSALFSAIRTERAGGAKLLGYYHSHPSDKPEPSACDHAQAAGDGKVWLIIGDGRITAWETREKGRLTLRTLCVGNITRVL